MERRYTSFSSFSAVKTALTTEYHPIHHENPPSPTGPGRAPRGSTRGFMLVADAFAILVPLALLGFLVAVCRLDGQMTENTNFKAWTNATAVLATLFTIIFASIVGRMTYEAAQWKLESGTTLASLEQLLGSRSVGSALTTQLHLMSFNTLGVALLLAWACSPLGSQSILRSLGSRLDVKESTSKVVWFDNLHESGLATWRLTTDSRTLIFDAYNYLLPTLYSTTLMSPEATKREPMDQWGNVKIPFLTPSGGNASTNDGWQRTELDAGIEKFSSLAGLPIAGIPFGNSSISIESTYIELDCDNVTVTRGVYPYTEVYFDWNTTLELLSGTAANGTWQGTRRDDFVRPGNGMIDPTDFSVNDDPPAWSLALDNFIGPYWVNDWLQHVQEGDASAFFQSPERFLTERGIQMNPTRLMLQMDLLWLRTQGGLAATCAVRQKYVESRINCTRPDAASWVRNCTVVEQRPSQRPHPPETISHLNFPFVWEMIASHPNDTILNNIDDESFGVNLIDNPDDTRGGLGEFQRLIPHYLHDPTLQSLEVYNIRNYFGPDDTPPSEYTYFENVDKTAFGRRLAQILNTYILLSQVFLAAQGGSQGASVMWRNVTDDVPTTVLVEVYHVSWLWTALGFAACGLLLAAGVASVVMRHMVAGPEVLGYASTVIRDSRFVGLPPQLAGMDGLDISRAMWEQKVRYGYVDAMAGGQPTIGVGREEETVRLRGSEMP